MNSGGLNAEARARALEEINLYEELVDFIELSPEDQRSYLERQCKASSQTAAELTPDEPIPPQPILAEYFEETVPAHAEAEVIAEEPEMGEDFTAAAGPVFVNEDAVKAVTESPFINAEAKEPGQRRQGSFELPDLFRASGPLSGLMLRPEITFTGALTKGVCLACGAESGVDDLFCVTCGAFIDEVDSTLQLNPACVECGQRIVTDEIFCPWCGAVLPAA